MRRLYENRRSFDTARKIRETFVDRPMRKVTELGWHWPKHLMEVGTCDGVMYRSDKWQEIGNFIDYKHVSEAPQRLYVIKDGIADFHTGKKLQLNSERVPLVRPMPDAIAELAAILGVTTRLYDADGEPSSEYTQINIARAKLGAAEHPKTGEPFLIVYTPSSLWGIVTGDELAVEKDGITG